MHVEIELKKGKKRNFDFESLVLRKFRKITAISHPWCYIVKIYHSGLETSRCNTRNAVIHEVITVSNFLLSAELRDKGGTFSVHCVSVQHSQDQIHL